jgi:tRNA(Ile)-lysidine synthase
VNRLAAEVLETALVRVLDQLPLDQPLAVGLSGGPDSSALAICLDQLLVDHQTLLLFHVHHGLSDHANDWQAQVQALADLIERPLFVRRVAVDLQSGLGLEGAARVARRDAITDLAREHKVSSIFLGHHQQDQAETVFMRLLRGSGVEGLAAMAPVTTAAGLTWVRPWLDEPRELILDYLQTFTQKTGWLPVDDPSNRDGELARGTLRRDVIPAMATHWPAWSTTLSRHAKQAARVSRMLKRYGQQLIRDVQCDPPHNTPEPGVLHISDAAAVAPVLSLVKWRALQADEQALVIRTWLAQAKMQMPTDKRLSELLRQLNQVHAMGHDRQLKWQQRDGEVLCIRGQLHLRVKL